MRGGTGALPTRIEREPIDKEEIERLIANPRATMIEAGIRWAVEQAALEDGCLHS